MTERRFCCYQIQVLLLDTRKPVLERQVLIGKENMQKRKGV